MKKRDGIFTVGVIFLALWISYIPYLLEFPLQSTGWIKDLAEETYEIPELMKDQVEIGEKNQMDIEDDLLKSSRAVFFKSLIMIVFGIVSAILILKRKYLGRLIALGLSAVVLGIKGYPFFSNEDPLQLISWHFTVFLSEYPFRVIHLDIITGLVLLITLGYLLRPSVGKRFYSIE